MKTKLSFVWSALFSLLLAAAYLPAQVPQLLNYQGKLANSTTSELALTFSIYPDTMTTTFLWRETQPVKATNGVFNVLLGKDTPFPSGLFNSGERYLGVKVGTGTELKPRARIASVAYAIKAESANSLDAPDGNPTDAVFVDNAGNIGIGTTQPTDDLELSSTGATGIKITSTGANTKLNFAPAGLFGDIFLTTADGSDTKSLRLGGGGDVTTPRGAALELRGNEYNSGTNVGDAILSAGEGGRILLSNGNVGIGTTIPKASLDVNGGDKSFAWGGDHSESGYIRMGNLQICWGSFLIGENQTWTSAGTGNHSYLQASQTITFQKPFKAVPTVTISPTDGAIDDRSAYVSFYRISTLGITEIYLSSPRINNVPTNAMTLNWMAIGTWQ